MLTILKGLTASAARASMSSYSRAETSEYISMLGIIVTKVC